MTTRESKVRHAVWEAAEEEERKSYAGKARRAFHSFELGHPIGIAVVDRTIREAGKVTVSHPDGTTDAVVTPVPFVERDT